MPVGRSEGRFGEVSCMNWGRKMATGRMGKEEDWKGVSLLSSNCYYSHGPKRNLM